ncbi:nickel-dependent lactate racemase [Desulfovibrio aminophilus]|uniref:nickel-dependent lactate racemase n=1 Tax=Desulfovibrio aminophilus TaxID=81425 RepID=UPI003392D80E
MDIELPYGHGIRRLVLPDGSDLRLLRPTPPPDLPDPLGTLARAVDAALDTPEHRGRPAPESVAIAVPDETRPLPVKDLLPVLLDRLFAFWPRLAPSNVTVVVGGGLHPALSRAELDRTVPPTAARGCRVVGHDAHHSLMTDHGRTSRGTPVRINAAMGKAAFRVVLGQVDPHQFVGFTGGSKGITVGCASAEMIQANHGGLFEPTARAGVLAENPVRQDLNEAGRLIGIQLAVNVVLSPAKRIVWLGAGDPEAVLAEGAKVCAGVYGVALDEPFDIVLASCGGHPKDICLYQAQKGLNMACQAARPGGRVLLLAECPGGVGDEVYHDYVRRFERPADVLADFRTHGFRMGAHKAYLFGLSLDSRRVVLDSALNVATLKGCQITAGAAQATLNAWLAESPERPRIAVIPNANTTFFHRPAGQRAPEGGENK